MEKVYLNDFPREWLSEKTDLKSYFQEYSKIYKSVIKKKGVKDILKTFLPDDILLTETEFLSLCSMTDENQLKLFNPSTKKKKPPKSKTIKFSGGKSVTENAQNNLLQETFQMQDKTIQSSLNTKSELGDCEEILNLLVNNIVNSESDMSNIRSTEITHKLTNTVQNEVNFITTQSDGGIENLPFARDENYQCNFDEEVGKDLNQSLRTLNLTEDKISLYNKNTIITSRSEILFGRPNNKRSRNFNKGEEYIVSFRIHEPFPRHEETRIEKMRQEILLLGTNTLENLRDKIICQSDYQDVRGDVSASPDGPVNQMSRDIYKSALFYLDNTFYVDSRNRGNVDYSSEIRAWALPRGIAVGKTKNMNCQLVGDLKLRFGYPYVYMHQGCCEHLVIINDARLVTSKDSMMYQDYPLMSSMCRHANKYCQICKKRLAWWIVEGSERIIQKLYYQCKICFKMFNYKDGKKIGNFKAFRFNQKNTLL